MVGFLIAPTDLILKANPMAALVTWLIGELWIFDASTSFLQAFCY